MTDTDETTERESRDTDHTTQLRSWKILRWIVLTGSGVVVVLLLVVVIGFSDCGMPEPPELPDPIDPPQRTSVQDEAIRDLTLSVAQNRLCDQMRGRLLALPDSDAPQGREGGATAAIGRFWIEQCSAEQRDGRLAVHLEGRGWTWANETRSGPMGSSFAVRGYLRVRLAVNLVGELDLGYHPRRQIATVWLTPTQAPDTSLTVQGELPVEARSGWSGVIGVLGRVVGSDVGSRARPIVERFGANEIARRLTPGLSVTAELCTGQLDVFLGALANGEIPIRPYPPSGTIWLDNQRVQIHPGGFDVAGPFDTEGEPLQVDVEVERGSIVDARVYCEAQGRTVIESFLNRHPAPPLSEVVVQAVPPGQPATVRTEPLTCPAYLVLTPRPQPGGGGGEARVRYRVQAGDGAPEPIVDCGSR